MLDDFRANVLNMLEYTQITQKLTTLTLFRPGGGAFEALADFERL